LGDLLIAVLEADWICIFPRRHHPHEHNRPQDVGVTHWKPGSGGKLKVNPVPRTYVRGFRVCPSGPSEDSPREIAARGAFRVMTEEIISRGSSLHLRTGRSVVRGELPKRY